MKTLFSNSEGGPVELTGPCRLFAFGFEPRGTETMELLSIKITRGDDHFLDLSMNSCTGVEWGGQLGCPIVIAPGECLRFTFSPEYGDRLSGWFDTGEL